jgi:ElaB/YqjD/DUF883 family membrane-anchored ribosome-binding protein
MENVRTEKLTKDMRAVVGDAEDLLKLTVNQTGERIEKVRERAVESLLAARTQLQDAGQRVNDQVHSHPWTTAGIAASIGLLLGFIIGRR